MVLLDVAAQMQADFATVNKSLDDGIKSISIMSGVILALIAWIWNSNILRQNKTETKIEKVEEAFALKFDKLTEQVTILVTLMGQVIPDTKENTTEINRIKENCATQNHKRKIA